MKRKILKIIQVVYDIVSLGFIIFISVALVVAPKVDGQVHEDSPSSLVERKTKLNTIHRDSGNIYTWGVDIGNDDFIRGLDYLITGRQNGFLRELKYSSTYSGSYASQTPIGYVSEWSNVDFDNPSNSTANYNLYGFEVHFSNKSGPYQNNKGYKFYNFTMTIKAIVDNGVLLNSGTLNYICAPIVNSSNEWAFIAYNKLQYNGTEYYAVWNDNIGNRVLPNIFESDNNYTFQQGYYKGYTEGSQGISSNVFSVMGQAFSAISNILSVEILPNFPLWILIFTPLIVAVVIVVVKMIKG